MQHATSISTLGSSVGESEAAERPSMEEYEDEEEEEREEEQEQEEEEEEDSLERLSPSSDSEEPVVVSSPRATTTTSHSHSTLTSPPSSSSSSSATLTSTSRKRGISRCEATEEELDQEPEEVQAVFEEEEGVFADDDGGDPDDEIVMEENQVEDFASSMLEAISCWHNRARALLSLGGTTVRLLLPAAQNNRNPTKTHFSCSCPVSSPSPHALLYYSHNYRLLPSILSRTFWVFFVFSFVVFFSRHVRFFCIPFIV